MFPRSGGERSVDGPANRAIWTGLRRREPGVDYKARSCSQWIWLRGEIDVVDGVEKGGGRHLARLLAGTSRPEAVRGD